MKFIKFPEATHNVQMTSGDPMHYFTDGEGNLILCAEIDKEDIKFIRDRGRVYLLLQGFKSNIPPPCGIIAFDPFKLKLPTQWQRR